MILRAAQDHLGEGLAQRGLDSIQNGADIRNDLVRPESYHAKMVAIEPCCTARIMHHLRTFAMLATIHFDHQARRQADEIREVWPQRKLATKAQTVELFLSQ